MEKNRSTAPSFQSVLNRLTFMSGSAAGWVTFAMMTLVTVAVFSRRLFGYSMVFYDEYSAYMMVFCVFLGGAYTLQQDGHVRVDFVVIRLQPRTRKIFRLITSIFSFSYGLIMTWQTAKLVLYYKEVGQRALSIMETPTWIPAIAVPVGLLILSLQMAVCILQDIRAFSQDSAAR